jgi:vancomycin resistance protein YoaR
VLALVTLLAGVDLALSAGRIHPGVKVGDAAVGRMRVSEAAAAIAEGAQGAIDEPVALVVGDQHWDITADQIGASVDATGLAASAFAVGRSASFVSAVGQRLSAWVGGTHVPLVATADPTLLEDTLDIVDDAVGMPAVDAAITIKGTTPSVVPPTDGTGIDYVAASAALLEAFTGDRRTVTLEITAKPAAILEAQAQRALESAKLMLSGPVTLTYESASWVVEPTAIAGWLAFRSVDTTVATELECYLDSAEVTDTVNPMVAQVGRPAKDATFKASAGTVSIVPSQDGLGLDGEDLIAGLAQTLTSAGERVLELPMRRVEASITTDKARGMGIKERLATFTTDFSPSNKPRVNNIHTLADALDGALIAPGGTFSFNGTIGPRTAEKGYQEANAIVNGKLVPELGGGVCQVATTVFNTIFFSGMPVVERRNHSLYISHYPKGRDAAVSWGGPDVKFKNDTEHWVLVATAHTNSTVTISLYGTDPGYDVSYKTGEFTDFKDYPVQEVKDAKLPKGTRIIDEKGVRGRSTVVTRTVTKNGAVLRTDTFKSVYRASEEVVRVGTKVVAPSTPTTTTP